MKIEVIPFKLKLKLFTDDLFNSLLHIYVIYNNNAANKNFFSDLSIQ